MKRKPATRVFQHFPRWRSGHAEPIRRSVGTRPRSEATRTRGQRKENAIRDYSRLFAVGFLMCPYPAVHESEYPPPPVGFWVMIIMKKRLFIVI